MDQLTPEAEADRARIVAALKEPKPDRYAGLAKEIETLIRAGRLDGIPEIARQIAIMILGTPAAEWREKGLPDPHGTRYSRQRAATAGGHMTDDEVANAVFMVPNIENQTIAKERIRWLSRSLVEAERNVRHWREEVGKLRSKDPAAVRERAFELTPAAQHDLATALAANVGYVLAGEPEHPDSPHRAEEWVEVTDGKTLPGDRFSYVRNPETGIGQITSHKRRAAAPPAAPAQQTVTNDLSEPLLRDVHLAGVDHRDRRLPDGDGAGGPMTEPHQSCSAESGRQWQLQHSVPSDGFECFYILKNGLQIAEVSGPQNVENTANLQELVNAANLRPRCAMTREQIFHICFEHASQNLTEDAVERQSDRITEAVIALLDQPQTSSTEEIRQRVEDAIRTFCRSLGGAAVQMSHGEERIYYAGISLKALSVAATLAMTRPQGEARAAPPTGPFTHWPRDTHALTVAQVAAIHAPELPDDALVTVAQLNEALIKLTVLGSLARETIACLAPSAASR